MHVLYTLMLKQTWKTVLNARVKPTCVALLQYKIERIIAAKHCIIMNQTQYSCHLCMPSLLLHIINFMS